MSKVFIIEVDLGIDIDEVINEDVAELVGESQQKLETAISVAKESQEKSQQRKLQQQESTDRAHRLMMKAYSMLEEAGASGVPAKDILATVQPTVATASAFSLRMKKILKNEGNEYMLERKKINSEPHYIFSAYNQSADDPASGVSQS